MLQSKIISCVLDVEKIEPDNWELWWQYWNGHKSKVVKKNTNHNRSFADWEGMDLYRSIFYDTQKDIYSCKYYPIDKLFPNMLKNILALPIKISFIRALSSLEAVSLHNDFDYPTTSLRIMLYDNNKIPTFFYKCNGKIKVQKLPNSSNCWIYDDHKCYHGTLYQKNYFKILLMIVGMWDEVELEKLVDKSLNKYHEYCVMI